MAFLLFFRIRVSLFSVVELPIQFGFGDSQSIDGLSFSLSLVGFLFHIF